MLNSLVLLASASALLSVQGYGAGPAAPAAKPAATAAQGQAAAAAATATARSLKDVPNITIKYYDVTGKDPKTINRSIAKQRPLDPATKQPSVAGTNWTLGASMTKRTVNGQCTVVAAKGEFAATAELPRLTTANIIPAGGLEAWQKYVAQLEKTAADNLWFVADRLPQVEQAMVGKECNAALAAGTAAIEKLKRDAADYQRKGATAKLK
jgi:predicted secreted Zn-dependent protease